MRSLSPARCGRLFLALAAVIAAPGAAAQGAPAPAPAATQAPAKPAAPAEAAPAAPAAPADEATREAVRREIEKVRQELRDEIRAEIQGQQSAKEFLQGADAEERRLEFFQVDGYLRLRGGLFNGLDLNRGPDPKGFSLYPRPLISPEKHSTLTNANMRLRIDPTLNVSEQIRIHAQLDALDNVVLGSTPDVLFQRTDPVLGSRTQLPPSDGFNIDRDSVRVKRAWAEVQTPVGLLAFGRQRAEWGAGLFENAGEALDDDLGDSVDRVQFAIPLRSTPIGPITVIPTYDWLATGAVAVDPRHGRGLGQPLDREQSDDAKAIGLKVARVDTAEERRLKLEQGLAAWNYGLYYSYRSQGFTFPTFDAGVAGALDNTTAVRRDASAHVLDLWWRRESKRWKLEWEGVGIIGSIANGAASATDPATGQIAIRQFGSVLRTSYEPTARMRFGAEGGIASGDRAPGFGNRPGRCVLVDPANPASACQAPTPGDIEGPQFFDRDLRNFRFNPAYRVDLVLWREILGNVTDAWYLKPSFRYSIIDNLSVSVAVIYSEALYASSTPSTRHKPLGLEGDLGIHYKSDDGFSAWVEWGVLQPLDGLLPLRSGEGDLSRAHAIRSGLAVKF